MRKEIIFVAFAIFLFPSLAFAQTDLQITQIQGFTTTMIAGDTYTAKYNIKSYSSSSTPIFFTLYLTTTEEIEESEFNLVASINGFNLNCSKPFPTGYPREWEFWKCMNSTTYYYFPPALLWWILPSAQNLILNLSLNIAASPKSNLDWEFKTWVEDTLPPEIVLESPLNGSMIKSGTLLNFSIRDNVKLSQAFNESQIFYDNFDDGDDLGWTNVSGKWNVESEEYSQDSGETYTHYFTVIDNSSGTNQMIEARLNVSKTYGTINAPSVLVRFQNETNFYMCQLRMDQNELYIVRRVNGVWSILNRTSFITVSNEWHTLKCKVENNNIFAYVHNSTHGVSINTTDASISNGRVGLNNYNTHTHFDNISVVSVGPFISPYDMNTSSWAEGLHPITIHAIDIVGNQNRSYFEFIIDDTPPIVTDISINPDYASNWTNATPTITATIYENGSGLKTCRLSSDNGASWPSTGYTISGIKPWYTCSRKFGPLVDGSLRKIRANVSDNLDNINITGVLAQRYVDRIPPNTTKVYGTPFYTNSTHDWITSSTQINLIATDLNKTPSGVNRTEYRINSGVWNNYTGPFFISTEGIHTIHFRSIDNVNNTEVEKSQIVLVDNTPPITNKTIGEPKYWNGTLWVVNSFTLFNLTASDELPNGVNNTYYRYCSGIGSCINAWNDTIPFSIIGLPDGLVRIEYFSTDVLNNTEPIQFEIDILDNTPPKVENSTIATDNITLANKTIEVGNNVTIFVDVFDLNGVSSVIVEDNKTTNYTMQPGSRYTTTIFQPSLGNHSLRYYANDTAGNINSSVFDWYNVTTEIVPPVVTSITLSDPSPTKAGNVNFTIVFSEYMDQNIYPNVTFNKTSGPTQNHTVRPYPGLFNGWLNNNTWVGNFTINSNTGEGLHRLFIYGARDLSSNLMVPNSSFTFLIDTITPIARNINVPNIADSQGQTISTEVLDPGSSGIDKVLVKITFPNSTNITYPMIFSPHWTYYMIWSKDVFGPGNYSASFIFNDSANNTNSSLSIPFIINSDPSPLTVGKIAFLCRNNPIIVNNISTCNYGIEDELISWLRKNGWNVTVNRYNLWSLSQLVASNLIVCSDTSMACNPTLDVKLAHQSFSKPFVEISNTPNANAALVFGYVINKGGSLGSFTKEIIVTVADNITAGYFRDVRIFNKFVKIPSLPDYKLKVGTKDLAAPNNDLLKTTLFSVAKNSNHGSYAYVGWFYGISGGWTPNDLTQDGSILLNRTLNWARCSNPIGCN